MGRLKGYIHPYRFFIALTLAIKLGGAVAELFVPYFMEKILREGTMPHQQERIYI